ncbi:MAG: riboflavin synthase [Candidatus Lustribacter sp.]|jgi:riboflavin synthase
MFSGLISHLGRVAALRGDLRNGMVLTVEAPGAVAEGVAEGDSIAINGVCLTVVKHDARTLTFDIVPESIARAGFDDLREGAPVNVEPSLRVGDRLGGHLVYGHVDANATIAGKPVEGQGHRLTIERPPAVARYIVEKGFIAIDGVSLTIASVTPEYFTIALIPETSRRTTLGAKGVGARVNIEIDPVARYAFAAMDEYRGASDANAATDAELAWAYEI